MQRLMQGGALAVLLLATALAGQSQGQDGKTDALVDYIDRATKKTVSIKGKIEEENPGGIKIKVREGKKESILQLAPADIVYVQYFTEDKIAYRRGFIKESNVTDKLSETKQKSELALAVTEFLSAQREIKGRPEARRYLAYKAAMASVRLGMLDKTRMDGAIRMLKDFATEHRGGWQILLVLKTLAQLLEDRDDADGARAAYEQIAGLSDIPKELARQSEVLVSKLYMRAGKYPEAEKKLTKLAASLSAGDSDKPYIDAYLAESKIAQGNFAGVDRTLEATLKATADNQLRGVLHNLLGEVAIKKGAAEDAFWHFLRVDALYNENPDEQARALHHLSTLFDKVKKDPVRARECLRRLASKSFEATRYGKLAAAKEKASEEKGGDSK